MGSRRFDVGTTQEDLAKIDRSRVSLTVFNVHPTAIAYMKEGGEVSSGNGIPIRPNGNVGLTFRDDGELVWERWVIISDTASTGIVVVEGFIN